MNEDDCFDMNSVWVSDTSSVPINIEVSDVLSISNVNGPWDGVPQFTSVVVYSSDLDDDNFREMSLFY